MIPIKDKKYMINCQGPYDYNRYMGEGVFTGEVEIVGEICYGFIIPTSKEVCFFLEEEIVAEFTDNNQVRPLICDPDNYPEDSNYCETCGSCGETGCCSPTNCQAVKCKYGEINLKDYECFQNQWDIMHNALRDIASNYNLDDGNILRQHLAQLAHDALNAVDKEWDKLYSKKNNE
jgi:hypothetical protein